MINTIVFDMGGVIFDYDSAEIMSRYTGLTDEDRKLLQAELFDDNDWIKLDRGQYTNESFEAAIIAKVPERLREKTKEIIATWYKPMAPIPLAKELLAELKEKGYKLYLLSNAGPAHDVYFPTLAGSEYFDGKVVSAYEHCWKPMPEIYEILFKRFDLKAEECVFVDDLQENIDTANQLGMAGILFKGIGPLRDRLAELGVL